MTAAEAPQPRSGTGSSRPRLILASAQVCVIAALAWLWSTGSSDPTATSVDRALVWLTIATPLALALSGWIGWRLPERFGSAGHATIRGLAFVVQLITLALLVAALLTAPFAIFGAVVFGPIG